MERLIASCGIDCATCDARIATLANDNVLKEKTAKKWAEQFSSPEITAETINCMGCLQEGVKFAHCYECEIRNCAHAKGYRTCAECKDLETCSIVGAIFQYMPELKENLKSLN
jgi:hypothetical protein